MPNNEKILVVDDEAKICESCVKILSKVGLDVQYALDGYEALRLFGAQDFSIVITDLKMSSMGGMELLRRLRESHPETMVIVITGYATVSSAVEVMKLGAVDYLPKPFTPEELRGAVRRALDRRQILRQNQELRERGLGPGAISHQLIGTSPQIKTVIKMVEKVAPTDSTVLIYGESGTGKELIARAIHVNSKRKDKVFFAVDCGTLSGNLLESELFGYRKGAFTGAQKDKKGVFELANGGTVFLDEISNLSLEVQGKLLRFLETREFLPLGGSSPQKVDIRLVLATNKDLKKMVVQGVFREDFFYRIYVYPIIMPPLRERKEDILPIAYHFLHQFASKMKKNISGFDPEAMSKLASFDWPGNVRQLRNVIERAVILCDRGQIGTKDLPLMDDLQILVGHIPETNEELKKMKKELRKRAVSKLEKDFVLNALKRNNWNVTRAAKQVGMQRSNFHNLMKKHGIARREQ